MIYLTNEQVSNATKANAANVAANWPLVCRALEVEGINHPLVQVGVAATIAIETGSFVPLMEKRASKDRQPSLWAAQERYWPSGYKGRGYVQLTWDYNYRDAGRELGIDLVGDPDLAMDPAVAGRVLAWFFKTRPDGGRDRRLIHRACRDSDWEAVRRGINGSGYAADRAGLARYLGFCNALAKIVGGFNG
jgi:predicted chitinase